MKKKIMKVSLLVFIGLFIFTSGVVAAKLSAKDIGFTSANEEWQVNNVEDAMNDLYKLQLANDKIKYFKTTKSGSKTSSYKIEEGYKPLLVLVANGNDSAYQQCKVDWNHDNKSFRSVSFAHIACSYDASTNTITATSTDASGATIQMYYGLIAKDSYFNE